MIVKKEQQPESRLKLTLTANAAEFREAFKQEVAEVAKTVKVAGFRPGKAPEAKVIQAAGRQRLEAGALDRVVSKVYFEDLTKDDIIPVETPNVNITSYTAPDDSTADDKEVVKFVAEVDVAPEVSVKGYDKIKLKKPEAPKITEDEVEKVFDYLRKQNAKITETPKDAVVENEMWVDLAYEGSIDGVKRTDMASKNHPIVMGEGQLIPGFEEAMMGMKAGESKTFPITFPKEYHATELAGKKAEFTVTINELKKVELPAKDEKLAEQYGHKTFAELEKAIRENLDEEKIEQSQKQLEEGVLEELLKVAKFDVPKALIEQELERLFVESKARLEKMQFQWDAYLQQTGKTVEQLRDEMRPQAEKNVRSGLALGKVIQEEKITNDAQAGRKAVDRLIEIATK
jgi:trigger factor